MRLKIFLFLFLLFLLPKSVFAEQPKFSITTNVSYKISDNGDTTVTQIFNATNLTNYYAPSEYSVSPGLDQFDTVKAYDQKGAISYQISGVNQKKQIELTFDHPTLGIDKQYSWTLVYNSKDFAKKIGRLWNIYIPKPADFSGLQDFSISLYVPNSFGKKVYLKPQPNTSANVWTKAGFNFTGIYAVYDPTGTDQSYQSYDFKLDCDLYNPKLYAVTSEITLPPDTAYQKIFFEDISPKPINVNLDPDGNWIAQYQLGPAAHLDVLVNGSAAVYFDPVLTPVGQVNLKNYTVLHTFWQTSDKKIAELAQQLKSVDNIYSFLSGNHSRDTVEKLTSSKGVLGYTNLFVSLARSIGVPSRAIDGFNGQKNLYSWPQYYNFTDRKWTDVDPAMGKATGVDFFKSLDFNHFALAIHGKDSRNPQALEKFEIVPVDKNLDINTQSKIGIRADIPTQITSGFGSNATIYIENYGPTIYPGENISLSSDQLTFDRRTVSTGVLLPYSSKAFQFAIMPQSWTVSKNAIIRLNFENEARPYNVQIKPVFKNGFLLTISILFVLGILSIIAQITRGIFLSRHPRKGDLRR